MKPAQLSSSFLGALGLALAAAFVLLPQPLASSLSGRSYGDERQLTGEVSSAFVGYWRSGRHAVTPELAHLVGYWRMYQAVKAVTAMVLLAVLVVLATRLWKTYARSDGHSSTWSSVAGGVAVTFLAVSAFAVATATIQATLAPFASLMSMLPVNSAEGQLQVMIGQVQQELAGYPNGSRGALRMMVGDLAWYHVVVAVISSLAIVVLIVLGAATWRAYARKAKADRRSRRLFRSFGIASILMTAALAVLALANAGSAVDSPAALLSFYQGTF